MKKILIALIVFPLFLFTCQKEETPKEKLPYWGMVTATKNGTPWTANPFSFVNIVHGNGFEMHLDSVITDFNIVKEGIEFYKIPFSPGTYPVKNTYPQDDDGKTGASFAYREADLFFADYTILEADSSSFITLSSFDSITGESKGTFDLTFIVRYKSSDIYPDTVRFRDGVFHTRYIED